MNDHPPDQPLVAICVPSGDMLHADFAFCLARMIASGPGASFVLANPRSSLITTARNACVSKAQEVRASHLLFLDSDMVFPADTLRRLLAHEVDFAASIYRQRNAPFDIICEVAGGSPTISAKDGLREMKRVPLGCALIRMSVFERLKRPYFRIVADERSGVEVGEDLTFCDAVRLAGVKIWADMVLAHQIGHVGQSIYGTYELGHQTEISKAVTGYIRSGPVYRR